VGLRLKQHDRSDGVVLADVGGTNVRFAVLRGGTLGPIEHMIVADYGHFADALAAFMTRQGAGNARRRAVFGVAGAVEGERCRLTNNPWTVDAEELRKRFGFTEVRIINDFEAIAWSLPRFSGDDLRAIGGQERKADAPMVVIGPGTGLGVAAYVPDPRGAFVVRSEGGHTTLPAQSSDEDEILRKLRERFGHVSAERALSGPGLENLYQAIASRQSASAPIRTAPEILLAAETGNCPASRAALDVFCALLGTVAGNFALSFGARGGVFIAGGIAPRMRDYLPQSLFRARFEAKGRMRPYVEKIPVFLIVHDDPAFVGLQSLAF